jgi:hypothetical protein
LEFYHQLAAPSTTPIIPDFGSLVKDIDRKISHSEPPTSQTETASAFPPKPINTTSPLSPALF